jgi:hypothetical protein
MASLCVHYLFGAPVTGNQKKSSKSKLGAQERCHVTYGGGGQSLPYFLKVQQAHRYLITHPIKDREPKGGGQLSFQANHLLQFSQRRDL